MRSVRVWMVRKTWAVHVQSNMNGTLTQTINQRTWYIVWIAIPPLLHRSQLNIPVASLIILCIGKLTAVLATISASAVANPQILTGNSCHISTLIGYPVSLTFLNIVVITMIVKAIQKRTKNPWKSLYSDFGSKWDTRDAYSIVGKRRRRDSARICFRADDIDWAEGRASGGSGVERPLSQVNGEPYIIFVHQTLSALLIFHWEYVHSFGKSHPQPVSWKLPDSWVWQLEAVGCDPDFHLSVAPPR